MYFVFSNLIFNLIWKQKTFDQLGLKTFHDDIGHLQHRILQIFEFKNGDQ